VKEPVTIVVPDFPQVPVSRWSILAVRRRRSTSAASERASSETTEPSSSARDSSPSTSGVNLAAGPGAAGMAEPHTTARPLLERVPHAPRQVVAPTEWSPSIGTSPIDKSWYHGEGSGWRSGEAFTTDCLLNPHVVSQGNDVPSSGSSSS